MSEDILDTIDLVLLGSRLKQAREESDISREAAAQHISSSVAYIDMVESGQIRVTAHDLIRLAPLYKSQIHFLLNGPLSYTSNDQAIAAYIRGEISEGILAAFMKTDRLEARRAIQEYQRDV